MLTKGNAYSGVRLRVGYFVAQSAHLGPSLEICQEQSLSISLIKCWCKPDITYPGGRLHLCARPQRNPCDGHASRGFDGILQVDGYAGYVALAEPRRAGGKPLLLAYCWAHARRMLHDIYQKDASEIAAEGLRRIAQLYKIEASIRGRSPDERLAIRQEKSAPLIADFRQWLTHQRSRLSAKSRLGKKLGYIHRH